MISSDDNNSSSPPILQMDEFKFGDDDNDNINEDNIVVRINDENRNNLIIELMDVNEMQHYFCCRLFCCNNIRPCQSCIFNRRNNNNIIPALYLIFNLSNIPNFTIPLFLVGQWDNVFIDLPSPSSSDYIVVKDSIACQPFLIWCVVLLAWTAVFSSLAFVWSA